MLKNLKPGVNREMSPKLAKKQKSSSKWPQNQGGSKKVPKDTS